MAFDDGVIAAAREAVATGGARGLGSGLRPEVIEIVDFSRPGIRLLGSWPRSLNNWARPAVIWGMTGVLHGPLIEQTGPDDHEGAGRSRFWDLTVEQRKAALPEIVRQADLGAMQADSKAFARGWLSELERVRRHYGQSSWGS